jgi:hypothetical protein
MESRGLLLGYQDVRGQWWIEAASRTSAGRSSSFQVSRWTVHLALVLIGSSIAAPGGPTLTADLGKHQG